MDLLALLWGTLRLRPYVFAFLVAHAWSAWRTLGARRAAAFTGIVWATAFAAEWTSTRVGFPFGFYTYTEATRGQELFLSNVPFVDSLSFAFLAWGSYALALVLAAPRPGAGPAAARPHGGPAAPPAWRTAPGTLTLAAACLVLSDVLIDPLAVRGERWFLGKIFEYPHEGVYFGVPLANFGGWAVVGAVGFTAYAALDRRWEAEGHPFPPRWRAELHWGAALWFAVAAFTLVIIFGIGEVALGLVGLTLAGVLAIAWAARAAAPLPRRAARGWQGETSRP